MCNVFFRGLRLTEMKTERFLDETRSVFNYSIIEFTCSEFYAALLENPDETDSHNNRRLFVQRELLGGAERVRKSRPFFSSVIDAVCNAVRDDLHLFHAHAAGRSGRGAPDERQR